MGCIFFFSTTVYYLLRENRNTSVKILNLCPLKASICVKKCAQKNLPFRNPNTGNIAFTVLFTGKNKPPTVGGVVRGRGVKSLVTRYVT